MMWLVLLVGLLVAFYFYCSKKNTYWASMGVKQTNPVIFLGDSVQLLLKRVSFPDFLIGLYKQGAGHRYIGFYQFNEPVLLIRDPELIKLITVKDFDHFTDHRQFVPEDIDPLWANNLFARRGLRWRHMRTTLSPAFTSSKMKNIFITIKETSERFIENFNEESVELDFKDTLSRYTNDLIAATAFGVQVDSIKNRENEFFMMGKKITKALSGENPLQFLLLVALPFLVRLFGLSMFDKKASDFFDTLVRDSLKYRKENKVVRPDMLNLLMEAQNEAIKKGETFADKDISAQCMIFFLAGFETISTLISFMVHELAVNQDIQDKLRQEILEIKQPLTYENLMKLPYLEMVISGKRWRNMRITLSPSFTSSKMKNIFLLMKDAAQKFIGNFDKKTEIDFRETLRRFATDIIATAAFGIEVDSIKNRDNEFYLMGMDISQAAAGGSIKLLAFFLFPRLAELFGMKFFGEKSSSFFNNLAKDTIKYREEKHIVRPDMLNLLMEARKGVFKKEVEATETGFATVQEADLGSVKEAVKLSDEDIAAQCLIFFLAGFETISSTMCFMCHELAVNQDVQDRLRKDIVEARKSCNGDLTYEVLMKIKYLDMVVSETLRKYPFPGQIDRIVTKEYNINPSKPGESTVHLYKGQQVLIPVFGIHRDPEYFPNPEKFDPERFNDENKHNINPYAYMPFGVGPRNCIGSRFALLEIKTLFFYLLPKFRIVPTEKSPIPLKFSTESFSVMPVGGFNYALEPIL